MKTKSALVLAAVVILPICMGVSWRARTRQTIQSTYLASPTCPWEDLGNLTASQAALAVTARDYSTVTDLTDAKTIQAILPNDASGVEFRFETTANADSTVINIYVAADNTMYDGSTEDSFTLGATLTLTGGQQTGTASNVFVDTIVVTASSGILTTDDEVIDSAADRMCIWKADFRGWKHVVVIATTLEAGSTLHAHARFF